MYENDVNESQWLKIFHSFGQISNQSTFNGWTKCPTKEYMTILECPAGLTIHCKATNQCTKISTRGIIAGESEANTNKFIVIRFEYLIICSQLLLIPRNKSHKYTFLSFVLFFSDGLGTVSCRSIELVTAPFISLLISVRHKELVIVSVSYLLAAWASRKSFIKFSISTSSEHLGNNGICSLLLITCDKSHVKGGKSKGMN